MDIPHNTPDSGDTEILENTFPGFKDFSPWSPAEHKSNSPNFSDLISPVKENSAIGKDKPGSNAEPIDKIISLPGLTLCDPTQIAALLGDDKALSHNAAYHTAPVDQQKRNRSTQSEQLEAHHAGDSAHNKHMISEQEWLTGKPDTPLSASDASLFALAAAATIEANKAIYGSGLETKTADLAAYHTATGDHPRVADQQLEGHPAGNSANNKQSIFEHEWFTGKPDTPLSAIDSSIRAVAAGAIAVQKAISGSGQETKTADQPQNSIANVPRIEDQQLETHRTYHTAPSVAADSSTPNTYIIPNVPIVQDPQPVANKAGNSANRIPLSTSLGDTPWSTYGATAAWMGERIVNAIQAQEQKPLANPNGDSANSTKAPDLKNNTNTDGAQAGYQTTPVDQGPKSFVNSLAGLFIPSAIVNATQAQEQKPLANPAGDSANSLPHSISKQDWLNGGKQEPARSGVNSPVPDQQRGANRPGDSANSLPHSISEQDWLNGKQDPARNGTNSPAPDHEHGSNRPGDSANRTLAQDATTITKTDSTAQVIAANSATVSALALLGLVDNDQHKAVSDQKQQNNLTGELHWLVQMLAAPAVSICPSENHQGALPRLEMPGQLARTAVQVDIGALAGKAAADSTLRQAGLDGRGTTIDATAPRILSLRDLAGASSGESTSTVTVTAAKIGNFSEAASVANALPGGILIGNTLSGNALIASAPAGNALIASTQAGNPLIVANTLATEMGTLRSIEPGTLVRGPELPGRGAAIDTAIAHPATTINIDAVGAKSIGAVEVATGKSSASPETGAIKPGIIALEASSQTKVPGERGASISGPISTTGSISAAIIKAEQGKSEKGDELAEVPAGKPKDPGIGLSQLGQGTSTKSGQNQTNDPLATPGSNGVQLPAANLPSLQITGQDPKDPKSSSDPDASAQTPQAGGAVADPNAGAGQDPNTAAPTTDPTTPTGQDPNTVAPSTDPATSAGQDPNTVAPATDPATSAGQDPNTVAPATDPATPAGQDPNTVAPAAGPAASQDPNTAPATITDPNGGPSSNGQETPQMDPLQEPAKTPAIQLENDRLILEKIEELQAPPEGQNPQIEQPRTDIIEQTSNWVSPPEAPWLPVQAVLAEFAEPAIQQVLQGNQPDDMPFSEAQIMNTIGQSFDQKTEQIFQAFVPQSDEPASSLTNDLIDLLTSLVSGYTPESNLSSRVNDEINTAGALAQLGATFAQGLADRTEELEPNSAGALGIAGSSGQSDLYTQTVTQLNADFLPTVLATVDGDESILLKNQKEREAKESREHDERVHEEESKRQAAALLAALKDRQVKAEAIRVKAIKDRLENELRQKYVVIKGDTLESIAQKRLFNKSLSVLIYELNKTRIPIRIEDGKRLLRLHAGLILLLPTVSEIKKFLTRLFGSKAEKFEYDSAVLPAEAQVWTQVQTQSLAERRKTASGQKIDSAEKSSKQMEIHQLSDNCRIADTVCLSENGEVYSRRLELKQNGFWQPIFVYEIRHDEAWMHEYKPNGSRRSRLIRLPAAKARQLANNDLDHNWEQYFDKFLLNQFKNAS